MVWGFVSEYQNLPDYHPYAPYAKLRTKIKRKVRLKRMLLLHTCFTAVDKVGVL